MRSGAQTSRHGRRARCGCVRGCGRPRLRARGCHWGRWCTALLHRRLRVLPILAAGRHASASCPGGRARVGPLFTLRCPWPAQLVRADTALPPSPRASNRAPAAPQPLQPGRHISAAALCGAAPRAVPATNAFCALVRAERGGFAAGTARSAKFVPQYNGASRPVLNGP